MKISVVHIDNSVPFSIYEQYVRYVSSERQERIKKYRHDKKKITSLFAELLIRYKFSDRCKEFRFKYGEHGKPYFADYPQYHFSVSHSGDYIVFAENSEPIGIDIEKIKENSKIARRFFTENEADAIDSSDEKEKFFTTIWTSKESYVKMLGTGFAATNFNTFNVIDNSLECRFISKQLDDYIVTVCGNNIYGEIEFEQIEINELTKGRCI